MTSHMRVFWHCRQITSSVGIRYVHRSSRYLGRTLSEGRTARRGVLPPRRDLATLQTPQALVRSDAQRSTIYALSTPPGKAGVAVIRVSGPEVLRVWRNMVSLRSTKGKDKETLPEPWKMYRCDVVHPNMKELLDSGLAVYFKGTPRRSRVYIPVF